MSLDRKKSVRKRMFPYGAKIVWASSNAVAKQRFEELLKLRDEYVKAGGAFKK